MPVLAARVMPTPDQAPRRSSARARARQSPEEEVAGLGKAAAVG